MSGLSVFENMIENKLLNLHTCYIAKVLSTNGVTAKIQPLGKTKAYGEKAKSQAPISNVPILQSAKYRTKKTTVTYVYACEDKRKSIDVLEVVGQIKAGDLVLCVCCERSITEAKKGANTTPVLGHHSMSASVIVDLLQGG